MEKKACVLVTVDVLEIMLISFSEKKVCKYPEIKNKESVGNHCFDR